MVPSRPMKMKIVFVMVSLIEMGKLFRECKVMRSNERDVLIGVSEVKSA